MVEERIQEESRVTWKQLYNLCFLKSKRVNGQGPRDLHACHDKWVPRHRPTKFQTHPQVSQLPHQSQSQKLTLPGGLVPIKNKFVSSSSNSNHLASRCSHFNLLFFFHLSIFEEIYMSRTALGLFEVANDSIFHIIIQYMKKKIMNIILIMIMNLRLHLMYS